ncbi:hypothetical protein [Streptomyces sp. SID14515]|uniref:hypothetical protein n=1 Tax=Streptomyces sp. SID14515 TaxID=2706074 RepID=UPI0013C981DF|nr:hypothetical protein [Streptomyces sp. SID14515]NEB42462.1 hypothetical protein [Streptomyces sp. SID14515]
MTLRSDVAELLTGAGVLDVDIDEAVADEHVRSSAYRRVVSATASARNRDQWSAGLLPEIDRLKAEGNRDFIRRRVQDWLFFLSIKDGHVPTSAELLKVSAWMQRVLAEGATSSAVLALLAESGSGRKSRNIARNRAGSRELRTR